MVLNKKETTIGYFCPACGNGVISMVGAFTLSGDMMLLKCPEGDSALKVTRTSDEKIRLEVPCFVCPKPHYFVVSQEAFFGSDLLCLNCSLSGFDACFIGEKEKVCAAMDETEKQILQTLGESGLDVDDAKHLQDIAKRTLHMEKSPVGGDGEFDLNNNFADNHIFDLLSFVVKDIIAGGDVVCQCPPDGLTHTEEYYAGKYAIDYDAEGITVSCRDCGAKKKIVCNSSIEANAFLECTKLYLQ